MHDAPRKKKAPLAAKLLAAALSTLLGLGAAELLVGAVRGFAFPALNIYEADADYGVRLAPNAETALRSRDGHVTDIQTNALGFRSQTPFILSSLTLEPVPGRVLLLGDSQAFGLGVEDDETMAVRLEAALGGDAQVLNAGVPTWGPAEMVRAARELVPRFRPATVVFLANMANDWAEAGVPNNRRVTAQDGWAKAWTPNAEEPSAFPGRRWLLGESHLLFAVRRLFAGGDDSAAAGGGVDWLLARLDDRTPGLDAAGAALARDVLAVRDLCRAHGCQVVLALLPLDVEADPSAWEKYRSAPRPLGHLRMLAERLGVEAARAGADVVDLLGPLAAAAPGCFLTDDYHLSARGHDVVARALAAAIGPGAAHEVTTR